MLDCLPAKAGLAEKARYVGLIGSLTADLAAYQYSFRDNRYGQVRKQVEGIFDKTHYREVALADRVTAADALGQAGDPRFAGTAGNWIPIPACCFLMGAQQEDPGKKNYDKYSGGNERPVHEVSLSEYKISKYPVTVGEFRKFVEDNGYTKEEFWDDNGWKFIQEQEILEPKGWADQLQYLTRPVVNISWYEAMAYCCWLGEAYSLPTETQWKRAARGGTAYRMRPWGKQEPDGKITHSRHNELGHAAPVGIFPEDCTPEGVLDMGVNVWEWCLDCYTKNKFYKMSAGSTDPCNLDIQEKQEFWDGPVKTLRGGSWSYYNPGAFRCCCRGDGIPHVRYDYVGFRVILRSY